MRRTKAEAEETRDAILDAAERVFYEHGVTRTTLEQIAAEAGVTRGAIYWHFKNKVELFNALHTRIKLPQEEIVERALADGTGDPLQAIHDIAIEALQTVAADERMQRVYRILLFRCEYVGEMDSALCRQAEAHEQMKCNVLKAFTSARAKGLLAESWPPEMAAKAFGSTMAGLFSEWLRFDRPFDVVAIGTRLLDELFRAFRASPS